MLRAEDPSPWSPESYPDAEGFAQRRQIILEGLASGGLDKWRKGYFSGGDPGKYLPGHAMAKLLLNPEDPEPGRFMNDDRSWREHYHFAAVNWARFWPLYGDTVLTEETRSKFTGMMKGYNYLTPGGTENHKTQWWTSAGVLPHFTGSGTNHKSKEATLAQAKDILHSYVKGLYMAGQGEWDSSTYVMFDVNGLLNLYDFSPDPEVKLLAQAGLDWLIAAYALKYTDGVYTAPNQRGYASRPYSSIADNTGYLWWAGNRKLTSENTTDFSYTLHPITSTWRPGRVIHNIATRNVKGLPAEQRNSKPNYWHGHGSTPTPGETHESLFIHPRFTLGSLWNGHASQHTRFMVTVSSSKGAVVFHGGHPRKSDHNSQKIEIGFSDGTGRYLQSVQSGPVYLAMVKAPEDEEADYSYFRIPAGLEPKAMGVWRVFEVEGVAVAVRSLDGRVELGGTPPDKKGNSEPILKFPGRENGFLVWVIDDPTSLEEKLNSVQIDSNEFVSKGQVSVTIPGVTTIEARFNPDPDGDRHGNRAAFARINGENVDLSTWKIYDGPFLKQSPGLLTVSDGKESFTVDFSGELPVYK
jgi:hypothetical protein